VRDNLLGTEGYCPVIRRTETLECVLARGLAQKAADTVGRTGGHLISCAASFLLLADSRASFEIEGERPPRNRFERWGRALLQAGKNPLSLDELDRLHGVLIEDTRFIKAGLRSDGVFLGERDHNGDPLPEFIGARPQDLSSVITGLIAANERMRGSGIDAVLQAAATAFGFVYVHPYQDGNGRLHRCLRGGQRQRVALARAIIAKPRLLLLDEPLSALDRNLRQQMQLELKTLQNTLGIAFMFVTHDQEEALTMSDRIVVMRAGRIEQQGTPRDIYRKPRNRFVAEFIGETNLFEVTVERIEGGEADARTSEGLSLRLPAAGLAKGQKVMAILRPTDFTLGEQGLGGTVSRAVYMGSDLHFFVAPDMGGPDIRVIARDGAAAPETGARVTLGYAPATVHVLEEA
jgi:hypothetical protein